MSTVQCPGTLQSHLTWYIVAILQNPSTDKTYNSTPYIHIKGNDSIAYLIFYFKIIFWKKVAPCHKALNIAISSVWRDKYLCPFLVVGSPSVICLSLYMTGYTWDYEKLKIKLKLKKKHHFTSSKSEIPSVLLHDYLGFIVNSVTHLKCQGYCNILCNKIVNYLVIIQVGKRTSASLS